MKSEQPVVSIIMATFNRGDLIPESLNSVAVQTFNNWECIIIDDGNSDKTKKAVEPFLGDKRFIYKNRSEKYKKGLPGSRNMGLDIAKGRFIIFFDDDDIVHPQNLELCVRELTLTKSIHFCRFEREVFTEAFNLKFKRINNYKVLGLNKGILESMITQEIPFNSCQVMWKKECFEEIRFNETLMYAEEWECYTRILSEGYFGVNIKEVLFFGRKHMASNTGEYKKKKAIRIHSHERAAEQILSTLIAKQIYLKKIEKYFIRLALELNSKNLMIKTLKYDKANWFKTQKYKFGFELYPILKKFFYLKSKLS